MNNDKTKINVDFSLIGDYFDTEYISKILNINPTEILKKGEFLVGKRIPNIETIWSIQTGFEVSLDINDQLLKIFNQLVNKREILQKICFELSLISMFEITILVKNKEIPVIYLENALLDFISSIGATIDIDIDI